MEWMFIPSERARNGPASNATLLGSQVWHPVPSLDALGHTVCVKTNDCGRTDDVALAHRLRVQVTGEQGAVHP